MRVASVKKGGDSAISAKHQVAFEFESKEEEREYKKACALLRGAADKTLRELGLTRRDADFMSITSKVHKGELLVFVFEGMVG